MKPKPMMLLLFLILLLSAHCDLTDAPDGGRLALTLEDVSCTEAWLTLRSTNLQIPNSIILKQNGQTRITLTLTTADTMLYIDSLLPNQSYKFTAVASLNNQQLTTNQALAQTLDTMSHNFTWQTWTFGEHSSSVLYDVAIIDENDIWAVGEIYMNDSLGQPDPTFYNAAHWNGQSWELERILYKGGIWSIRTIFVFNENDIWFAGYVRYFNGQFIELPIPSILIEWSINKIWGSSSNDLYAVGNGGNIAHYNGSSWTKIESGTTVDIQDIWGIEIDNTNENLILCAASNAIEPGEHKILRVKNTNNIDTINWISDRRVHSVWMDSKFKLFACGDGMFINSHFNLWKKQEELTFVFTERIRGNSGNDLFVVGDFGIIAHYNGVGWKEYREASAALVYTSLDMRNNLMITVGYTQRRAVIQKMIRN